MTLYQVFKEKTKHTVYNDPNRESHYLSVDLDYFNDKDEEDISIFLKKILRVCNRLQKANEMGNYLCIANQHHELIPHINSSNQTYNCLYNVDYHSDFAAHGNGFKVNLVETNVIQLAENNWVAFVRGRHHMTYVWIPPDKQVCVVDGFGLCNQSDEDNPFRKGVYTSYLSTKISIDLNIINWKYVDAIGIVLSPDYTRDHSIYKNETFLEIAKHFQLFKNMGFVST